jgi:serine/threonine protein kinase
VKRKLLTKDKKLSFLVDPSKEIGQGNEGVVSRADNVRAMKLIKKGASIDVDKLLALCNVGRKLPGIAWPTHPLYDEADSECVGYLMQFVYGRTLEDLIDNGETASFPPPTKIKLSKAIVATVKRVHENKSPKVVLGDLLKAGNLIIKNESATFVDSYSVSIFNYRTSTGSLTDSFSKLATPGYIPPEVLENPAARPDHAADCFALAVILFQLFFGQLPTEPKPSPNAVGFSPDDAVKQKLFHRYVESKDYEAPTYDPIEVPAKIDDLFRAAFLSVSGRPTPNDWEKALTKWQRECDVATLTRLKRIGVLTKLIVFAFAVTLKLIVISALAYSATPDSPKPTKPLPTTASPMRDKVGSPLFKELFR